MDRRHMLGGIAVFAASPAFAQSDPTPATPAMKADAPMTMSDAQKKHVMDTARVGSLSLALSRIALPKVKHASVKQFAEFEIAEQETIADILKAMQMPGAPLSGTVKAPTEAELMEHLDAEGKATVEKMRAEKPGAEFDRAYVKAEVDGHQKLLAIQDTYLAAPDNLDETNVAKLARGMIKEHLTLLGDIEKMKLG